MNKGDVLVCIKEFHWKKDKIFFYNIGDRCTILSNRRLIISSNRYMFDVSHFKYVSLTLTLEELNEYFITNVEHRRRIIKEML